jgi:hypothetical protein
MNVQVLAGTWLRRNGNAPNGVNSGPLLRLACWVDPADTDGVGRDDMRQICAIGCD